MTGFMALAQLFLLFHSLCKCSGGMLALCDVNEYRKCMKEFKVRSHLDEGSQGNAHASNMNGLCTTVPINIHVTIPIAI